MTSHQPIDTREQLGQLTSALFQAHGPVFGHAELLTDLCTQHWPPVFRDQIGVGIGIAPAARDPNITRAQGPTQLPEGTELIVMLVDTAFRVHDVWTPLHGNKVRRGLRRPRASMGSERFCLGRLAGLGDQPFELGHSRADEPLGLELLTSQGIEQCGFIML